MKTIKVILFGMLFTSTAFAQLMSPEREKILRSYIPKLEGHLINEKIAQAIIFTDVEIPPARQVQYSTSTVFLSTDIQFSQRLSSGPTNGLRWIYPEGTLIFDFLLKNFSDGAWACYTVRTRLREIDDWDADSYVGFRLSDIEAGRVTSRTSAELSKTFWVYELPPIRNARRLLLSRLFKPQTGIPLIIHNGHEIFAPTAFDHDNIIPQNYLGSAIGADRDSCRSCHQDTLARLKPVSHGMDVIDDGITRISKFKALWLPPSSNSSIWPIVVWKGPLQPGPVYTEGSDGIRSIHPIEPSSFGTTPKLRQSFLDAGIVAWYDPVKHPPEVYRQIKAYSNY